MSKKSNEQSRRWTWTSYTIDEVQALRAKATYIIAGEEICPKTGRQHYQGYLEMGRKCRLGGLKKIAPTTHFETSKGTAEENAVYCKKDGRWIEEGEKMKQGERNDLKEYVKDCKTMKEEEIMEKHTNTWAKYERLYGRVKAITHKNMKKPEPWVWVLCGPTGVGKSKIAEIIGEYTGDYFTMTGNYKWWEGYENNTVLILEDYKKQLKYADLLQLLDRYKCKREIKGGTIYITSPVIIITCSDTNWIETKECERRISVLSTLRPGLLR